MIVDTTDTPCGTGACGRCHGTLPVFENPYGAVVRCLHCRRLDDDDVAMGRSPEAHMRPPSSRLGDMLAESFAPGGSLEVAATRLRDSLRPAERAILDKRLAEARPTLDEATHRFRNKLASVWQPTIVCLCGSTKFDAAYRDANFDESVAGRIVLTCAALSHAEGRVLEPATKVALDKLHKHKIALADEILVLNVNGYYGESTASEIAYARSLGKRVRWLVPEHADKPQVLKGSDEELATRRCGGIGGCGVGRLVERHVWLDERGERVLGRTMRYSCSCAGDTTPFVEKDWYPLGTVFKRGAPPELRAGLKFSLRMSVDSETTEASTFVPATIFEDWGTGWRVRIGGSDQPQPLTVDEWERCWFRGDIVIDDAPGATP